MNWFVFIAVLIGAPLYMLGLYWALRLSDWVLDRFGIWPLLAVMVAFFATVAGLMA